MLFNTKDSVVLATKEDIYSCVTELDLFKYYVSPFKQINRVFRSELRQDRNPSAAVKISKSGRATYVDFSLDKSYTPIDYVMEKYGLSYSQACRRIADDFNIYSSGKTLDSKSKAKIINHPSNLHPKLNTSIKIVSKPFSRQGLAYWKQYGITKNLLELFNVKELSCYFVNNKIVYPKQVTFAYDFGDYKYKILSPYNENFKWISNTGINIIQGYHQIAKRGNLLFITKSYKDVIALRSIGAYAIAPQSETVPLNPKLIAYLKKRWKTIIIYYDNDPAGIESAKVIAEEFDLKYIHHPLKESKDPSDYIKDHGVDKYKQLLRELL